MVNFPDLFARLNPKAMPSIADRGIFQIMKRNKEDEGPAVLVLRISKHNQGGIHENFRIQILYQEIIYFTKSILEIYVTYKI